MKGVVDYLYKQSILRYFSHIVRTKNPHFLVNYLDTYDVNSKINKLPIKTLYESMDHFTVQAKMKIRYLDTLEKNYDINTDKEFVNTLISEGNNQINDYFIDYIDKKSDILEFPLWKPSKLAKAYHKFFTKNNRFSLKNKRIDTKFREYFEGILENCIKEMERPINSTPYIILSEDFAMFTLKNLKITEEPDFFYCGWFIKSFNSQILSTFINKKLPEKTVYLGYFDSEDSAKLKFYYYSHDDVLTEHYTLPDNSSLLNTEKVLRLNLYHKLVDINEHKFKKIVFK